MLDADKARGLRLGSALFGGASRCFLTISVIAVAAFTFLFAPAAGAQTCANANASVFGASRSQLRRAVVCLVNVQRRAHGLPRLRRSRDLNHSAQRWTNHMVRRADFSHGTNFAARITAAGFRWESAGENIATGFVTPASVVNTWMSDVGHCRNILAPVFRFVGVGVTSAGIPGWGSRGTWTEDFGLHAGSRPPSRNWAPADSCPW